MMTMRRSFRFEDGLISVAWRIVLKLHHQQQQNNDFFFNFKLTYIIIIKTLLTTQ